MMKNVCVMLIVLLLASSSAMAASILNSAHDMSGLSTFTSPVDGTQYGSDNTDRLCVFCHTPHAALSTVPLWNRNADALVAPVVYTSTTFDATMVLATGDTLLCMSCHDGAMTENLVNLNGATGVLADTVTTRTLTLAAGPALLGVNFTNDHPVGFAYNTGGAGLKPVGTADGADDDPADLTFAGDVWCSSCHDVHDPGTEVAGTKPFLRTTNTQSALCLACHDK